MRYGYYSLSWDEMVRDAKSHIRARQSIIYDLKKVIETHNERIELHQNKIKELTINYLGDNPMAKVSTSQKPTGKQPIGPKATIPIRRESNQVLHNPNQKQGGKPPGKPIRNL